jgi:hypothetical protein
MMTAAKIELAPAIAVGDADRLPAIITRASARLMEARDSAEVLEAKQTAEAALHFAKLTKATNETHADCLRIITRAEMRMADEIDKGQAAVMPPGSRVCLACGRERPPKIGRCNGEKESGAAQARRCLGSPR